MNLKEIITEVFNEASNGKVVIDANDGPWCFYTRFFYRLEGKANAKDSKYPIIEIANKEVFFNNIKEYLTKAYDFYYDDKNYFGLEDRSYVKKLFLDLIINASSYDFVDFISYIENKTKQLKNNKISIGSMKIGEYDDLDIILDISKNRSNLEGPYKMKITFSQKDNKDSFTLPEITFAVISNTAYIMAIQNKSKKDNELAKKLDRYFRKVNKGIEESSIISNISPNSLVSLSIFSAYFSKLGINKLIARNYLPIRYHANKVAIYNKFKDDLNAKKNNLLMHDYIQSNISDKFTNLFFRYAYHFDSDCYYDDYKQEIEVDIKQSNNSDNIIYKIDKCIREYNPNIDKNIRK